MNLIATACRKCITFVCDGGVSTQRYYTDSLSKYPGEIHPGGSQVASAMKKMAKIPPTVRYEKCFWIIPSDTFRH